MERPGFNPQALAREPGSQRSGANKEKKQAAQRVRSRARGGRNECKNGGVRRGHAGDPFASRALQHIFAACTRFYALALVERDESEDYGENRFLLAGGAAGSILVVFYTERGERIRIILVREANEYELFRKCNNITFDMLVCLAF